MVLVDTNVILDVVTVDPRWSDWSRRQLVHWLNTGPEVINAIIYGEIGFACERIESLDALLPSHLYDYRAIPREGGLPCRPSPCRLPPGVPRVEADHAAILTRPASDRAGHRDRAQASWTRFGDRGADPGVLV